MEADMLTALINLMGESIFKATWKSPFYNDILLCYSKSYYI